MPDLSDVFPDWRHTPSVFIEAMHNLGWKPGHTIERIIASNPLEPENIQFIPRNHTLRARRRNNTKHIVAFGVMAPIAWFIENHALCCVKDYHVIYGRISNGWSSEKAMTVPSSGRLKPKHCAYSASTVIDYNGVELMISEIKSSHGVQTKDLVKRLNLGWSIDQAVCTPINGIRPSRKSSNNAEFNQSSIYSESNVI